MDSRSGPHEQDFGLPPACVAALCGIFHLLGPHLPTRRLSVPSLEWRVWRRRGGRYAHARSAIVRLTSKGWMMTRTRRIGITSSQALTRTPLG